MLAGGVPKRSTGADCKSAGYAFVGSNPTPSTILWRVRNRTGLLEAEPAWTSQSGRQTEHESLWASVAPLLLWLIDGGVGQVHAGVVQR